jgi:HlyD family secretion protein
VSAASLTLALIGCRGTGAADGFAVSGHIEATEVRVSAEVGGVLLELAPREGDRVERGQLLARIDDEETRLALDTARAERASAAAELRLRRAGARAEEIAEARARLEQARAEEAGAQRELVRMQGLLASGSGTEQSRDAARTRQEAAASGRDAAAERLRRLEAGSRPEEIDAARARVAAADARIAQLEKRLADAQLESPVAGILSERLAEPGELVGPGTGLAVLIELDRPWLTVYVAEPELGRIRLGQSVEVVTDGGERRQGRLSFISSKAEFTPKNVQTRDERVKLVYKVEVELENADGLFKPGMPAEARLDAGAGT